MILLTKENVISYIHDHVPSIELKEPVTVNMIGDGDLGADVEGDGYCNYVFRVADSSRSYIVKQSRNVFRRNGGLTASYRGRNEYEIMKLRAKIVPQYVPILYHGDPENNIFIMEDVSNLKLVRYEMVKDHRLPRFAEQGAHYLAATHFYTSEFYLDTAEFHNLMGHFMNPELRTVFEDKLFLGIFASDRFDPACGPEFARYCQDLFEDPSIKFQRYKLRHLFMSKSETLIHGDFHTSNIFADDDHLKVIDMEYAFGAPFSYDLGFILANVIFQFSSAAFRPYPSEEERDACLVYLLSLFKMLYLKYIEYFFQFWEKDAKIEYKVAERYGYRESVALDILKECLGFAACVNFSRVCGTMETADFDCIKDNLLRTKAKFLSVDIDFTLFNKWNTYSNIDEPINDMITLMRMRQSS